MARYNERYAPDDDAHGLGDIARRNAQADWRDKFDTEQRTQNMPGDFGTRREPEPFDRGYRDEYGSHRERQVDPGGRAGARGYRGLGPKNYTRSDARIQEDICERLWYADDVDASDVTVDVQDGVVTLGGNVEQRSTRHHIEDIADDCGGVRDIHNEIRVQRRNA